MRHLTNTITSDYVTVLMRVIILLLGAMSVLAGCKKDHCKKVEDAYRLIMGEWRLVRSESVYRISGLNYYDTTELSTNNITVQFLDCYHYAEYKNDTLIYTDRGVFDFSESTTNFFFEFKLNNNNYYSDYHSEGTSSSPYYSLKKDTLITRGDYVYQGKILTADGTLYKARQINRFFVKN